MMKYAAAGVTYPPAMRMTPIMPVATVETIPNAQKHKAVILLPELSGSRISCLIV